MLTISEVGMSLDFLHGACAESQAFLGHQELIILDYSIVFPSCFFLEHQRPLSRPTGTVERSHTYLLC